LAESLSKTQVDRLGDRIRKGSLTESDLKLIDDYRRSFGEAYEIIVRKIREQLQLEPTGRPAKSTGSIIEKLHRESIRLSQVQDIAGCRVVVADISEQERVVTSLSAIFPGASIIDRRATPSYGYRAVHVLVSISGKLIEIQVRTDLQHLWAELSEKLADVFDPNIKYGGGEDLIRNTLMLNSNFLAQLENHLEDFEKSQTELEKLEKHAQLLEQRGRSGESKKLQEKVTELRAKIAQSGKWMTERKEEWTKKISDMISKIEKRKRREQ
jgi:ppGpp synthetase/RelA/SpoT-type nucleotidyltranferase